MPQAHDSPYGCRASQCCFVELGEDKRPIRIFRNQQAAIRSGLPLTAWLYSDAVRIIRQKVFRRDAFTCTHCGAGVTWQSGQMHERHPRGKIVRLAPGVYGGGEISVSNGTCLCYNCHSNTDAGHGKRNTRFGRQDSSSTT